MELDEIEYFSTMKALGRPAYKLAQRVVTASMMNERDAAEIQDRLKLLPRYKDDEHYRQCGNFMAELAAFDSLTAKGLNPHWVSQSKRKGIKMPDMEYEGAPSHIPVEVKHLNDPRDEHIATFRGQSVGGSVPLDYKTQLTQKVTDLINDAEKKFKDFHSEFNDKPGKNILYLYFTKSNGAFVADLAQQTLAQFDGQKAKTMVDHIRDIGLPLVGDKTTLIAQELDEAVSASG